MTSLFLGIDPDLHHTGIALVDQDGRVVGVVCCMSPAVSRGAEAVVAMARSISGIISIIKEENPNILNAAVEGQTISFAQTKNPDSIILLAHVTGVAVAAVNEHLIVPISIPTPAKWKGQVPKTIHQARICDRLGWAFEKHGTLKNGYVVPRSPGVGEGLKDSHWKHVMDAIGLALWARNEHEKRSTRNALVRGGGR